VAFLGFTKKECWAVTSAKGHNSFLIHSSKSVIYVIQQYSWQNHIKQAQEEKSHECINIYFLRTLNKNITSI
jgi:hypothetical protein